ncbi:MAG: hypothetical protein JWQ03_702, partial [Variovorax sp.]|nr:hypothetical protein [Variovorax sp.]
EVLQRELAAAHAERELISQKMAEEVAARNAAQQEATKRRVALEAEVDQLRDRLDEIAPLPDTESTSQLGRLQRPLAWVRARRMKFRGVTAALAIGLGLGAGAVGWWNHTRPLPPQESQVAETPVHKASGSSVAEVPLTVSQPPTPPAISAANLESRIQAAFTQQGLPPSVRVQEGLTGVSIDDEMVGAEQRAKADLIVRSAFAGAGLPEPSIEHLMSREAPTTGSRRPPAAAANRSGDPQVGVENDAPLAAGERRNPEEERSVPTAKNGGRSRTDAVATTRAVPHIASRSAATGYANPPKSLEASCRQQLHEPIWDPRRPWHLTSCMKQECCRQGVPKNEECRAFNQRYPMNCS